MSKEETPSGVVGICGCLTELVVDPVVSGPHEYRVLHGDAVGQHQEHAKRKGRLVRPMRPESMGSRCYALEKE